MCVTDEYNAESLLVDRETWRVFLETACRGNSARSNSFARLLFAIKEAIENGSDSVGQAINTLSDGIRLTYLHTDEHQLALRLYMLSLTGHLKPQDEPRILLNGAIERGMAEIERARGKRSAAKGHRTGKESTTKK